MPIICKGALLVTERNSRMSAMTNVACSRSSSVCHLYVLESVTLNARGCNCSSTTAHARPDRTHIRDFYSAQIPQLPCLANREGAVSVAL